jgi:hypothetical protein
MVLFFMMLIWLFGFEIGLAKSSAAQCAAVRASWHGREIPI